MRNTIVGFFFPSWKSVVTTHDILESSFIFGMFWVPAMYQVLYLIYMIYSPFEYHINMICIWAK